MSQETPPLPNILAEARIKELDTPTARLGPHARDAKMSLFEPVRTFHMNGVVYEHADRRPDFTGQTVRRFTTHGQGGPVLQGGEELPNKRCG